MNLQNNLGQKAYKKLHILLLQLEFPVWKRARKWSYSGHFALEEGLKANGVEPFIIPAMSDILPSSPLSWLSHARKLCEGKRFDQVWITIVHSPYDKAFFDWISTLAPVRLAWICESLEYLPEELLENPGLRGRKEYVFQQLQGITHVIAVDESDVDLINDSGIAKATLWDLTVPERFVSKQYIPPKNNTTAFFGLQYGKRQQFIQHPALQKLITYPNPPEKSIYYGRLFDDLQKTTFSYLQKGLPVNEDILKQYVDKLRTIRQGEFSAWIEGLKEWNAVVNLPSYVKNYTGRVIENMAAGRPVISWNIPDRPRVRSLFEDGKEILLFDQNEPLQLAEHLRHIQRDPDFARSIAENARSKVLRYHTSETGVRRILDWIETGEEHEYDKISEHLQLTPPKSKLLIQEKITQGEALFAEGKIEEAEKCFLEILNEDPKNKEACNNLGVISFQQQDIEQALKYFTMVLEIDPFYKDTILNYSALLKSTNRFYDSAPILEKAIERFPDDQEISRLLSEVRLTQRSQTKIAVLCLPGLQSFLGDIVDYLKIKYDVQTCYSNNNQEIESAVRWADIIWLEWANDLAVALTSHPTILNGKHVICRLHSYEAFAGYSGKINWRKISDLIFVAEHIKNILLQQVPDLLNKVKNIHIVPNGINLDRWRFAERKPGYEIAYVGWINYKKGSILLPHILKAVCDREPRYRLHIAGEIQDSRYIFYFKQAVQDMGLADNFVMHGRVDDVDSWLEDKNYIVSTSLLESQQLSLCEAMAKGIKPVIHNFVGAKGVYPEKYIWNTIPEFVHKVTEDGYNSLKYRKFIEQNYSLNNQLKKIGNILNISAPLTEKHTKNKSVSFIGSSDYWEKRYNNGGTSGAGSFGKLSEFKAEVLNAFVRENNLRSVIEFGCGDGNQLSLASYPSYIGIDVSETAIRLCKERFQHDKIKRFLLYDPEHFADKHSVLKADMVLSLDVIYHLIEDNVFELYMNHVFSVAEKFVIIYSSDFTAYSPSPHVKYRRFSEWIISRLPEWKLLKKIPNRYPYEGDERTGSLSDFYIYRKSCSHSVLKDVAPNGDNAKKNDQVVSFIHEKQEITLMLSDTDEHLSGIISSHKNFYELQMLDDIRKRVPPSGVFVDCGANIGNHGVYFGVICEASKVYAFEPMKESYNILLKNIFLNKLEGTIVGYNIALGKENTNGKLIVRDANNLGTSIIQECPEGDIVIRKLDDIIFADNDRGLKGIDLVKIDVEGMELDVLQGAKKVINKFSPLLYVEIQTDDEFRAIVDFLSPYGYEPKLRFNWTPTFLFETNKRRM